MTLFVDECEVSGIGKEGRNAAVAEHMPHQLADALKGTTGQCRASMVTLSSAPWVHRWRWPQCCSGMSWKKVAWKRRRWMLQWQSIEPNCWQKPRRSSPARLLWRRLLRRRPKQRRRPGMLLLLPQSLHLNAIIAQSSAAGEAKKELDSRAAQDKAAQEESKAEKRSWRMLLLTLNSTFL